MESALLLKNILKRFKERGIAQVQGYNRFGYLDETESLVKVSRENGKDTSVSFKSILIGIDAYQKDNELYDMGPSALRAYGITHVTSPVYALLHLLDKAEYYK